MTDPARILIVDDEVSNRQFLRQCLKSLGYAVEEAADGVEALERLEKNLPDLVLLDVQMPRMDGFTVCRRLKSDPATLLIPVVIVTSLDQIPSRIHAKDLGADDYLCKPINVAELEARVRSLVKLKRHTDELEHASRVFEAMAIVVERRDAYTGHHGKRVGEYAARVAKAVGLGPDEIDDLRLGGVFHDLGKIAVPDAVLQKPGRLTETEQEAMRTHPSVGYDLCVPLRTLERVVPMIRHHHERLDGSGYPDGLSGAEISLPIRIISVCDIFDALRTKRPYKQALPLAETARILREEAARGWWEAEIVEILLGLAEKEGGREMLSTML
ncbi:MAG: response regulator [Planctomycetes bacterium]|nr:response regulator [Planctomycetota bacterium]